MPEQALQLKDIKPIVEVPDHSLWFFAGLVGLVSLLLIVLAVFLLRKMRKKPDPRRREALRRLRNLDFSDTKQAVYDFSFLGQFVVSPRTETAFAALQDALAPYKYKKTVEALDPALRMRMEQFITEARRG